MDEQQELGQQLAEVRQELRELHAKMDWLMAQLNVPQPDAGFQPGGSAPSAAGAR